MARRRAPPSQGWKTFLRNHADGIAAMDLFVVPTIFFRPVYGLLIMGHGRRQILWFGVTAHPTAEWIANQLTEACCVSARGLDHDRQGSPIIPTQRNQWAEGVPMMPMGVIFRSAFTFKQIGSN